MPSNGIMEEILALLAPDKSSAEVIALGFNPSTVHKAQRLMRQQDQILKAENLGYSEVAS